MSDKDLETAVGFTAQQPAADDTPIRDLPARATCQQCGQVHPGGRFVAGCPGPRLQHGLHSQLLQSGAIADAEAIAALAERQAGIESDLGGAEQLSQVHRDVIRDLLRLQLVSDYLFERLQALGPLTAKGRSRAALSSYLLVVDRVTKLRQQVGLERRQKPVDPLEAIRAAVAEANTR